MKRTRILPGLVVAIAIGWPSLAGAEPRIALVIGNGAYDASLGPLANPTTDARAVAAALKATGFEVEVVSDLDQRAMKRVISRFGQKLSAAGPTATGLFFYAGHGLQSKGINYLAPIGAQIESEADIDLEAVAADTVVRQMEESGVATAIVILDACRNTPVMRASRSASRGLARMDAPPGSFVAYSTAPGQTAADGDQGSPFAKALVASLTQPGEPIEVVFRNVRQSVIKSTGGKQVPWDSSSLVQPFYFIPGAPRPATGAATDPQAVELALWNAVSESNDPAQLKAYLDRYPNGLFAKVAQARLKPQASVQIASASASYPSSGVGSLSRAPRMGNWGFDTAGQDPSVSARESLFGHANGAYMRRMEIPADRSSFGAFNRLAELSSDRLRAVVEQAARETPATGAKAKVGTFYRSYMDEAQVAAVGAKPLNADLARIRAAANRDDVARLMGETVGRFGQSFFNPAIYEDAKDTSRYAAHLSQGGLALPDRDYYLVDRFAPQRTAYQAYVARMLSLAGWPNAEANAQAILAMETEIARVSWTRADRRDSDKTYNPHDVADLSSFAPGFNWQALLAGAGLSSATRVVVFEESAFPKIAAIYARTDLDTLRAWLAFTTIDQAAPYLSKDFEQARFGFRETSLSGTPAPQPRWKRGVALLDDQLPDAVGKLYVDAYFSPASKVAMDGLVSDLQGAMGRRIQTLDWMSPETKRRALEKLSKFTVKIGYPDKWRDYANLRLAEGDLYGNMQRAGAEDWTYRVARLNRPVDRAEWGMTPSTVNAYYAPRQNEIVFPAAILQPPFFDPEGDPAVNYGAIGAVIGHEITHAFDDQGRKSDGDGRLAEWWTPDDQARFKAQADRLGRQYAALEVLPGAKINSDLTMGENIADLGGLLLALDAYRLSLRGQSAPVIDGLTGEQRVFLGWAQVWRAKYRDDRMRQMLVSDPHAPPLARVDLTVRNIDAFYQAFGVKPGDPMYLPPEQRVRIW